LTRLVARRFHTAPFSWRISTPFRGPCLLRNPTQTRTSELGRCRSTPMARTGGMSTCFSGCEAWELVLDVEPKRLGVQPVTGPRHTWLLG
jgi:hypothetical protein